MHQYDSAHKSYIAFFTSINGIMMKYSPIRRTRHLRHMHNLGMIPSSLRIIAYMRSYVLGISGLIFMAYSVAFLAPSVIISFDMYICPGIFMDGDWSLRENILSKTCRNPSVAFNEFFLNLLWTKEHTGPLAPNRKGEEIHAFLSQTTISLFSGSCL